MIVINELSVFEAHSEFQTEQQYEAIIYISIVEYVLQCLPRRKRSAVYSLENIIKLTFVATWILHSWSKPVPFWHLALPFLALNRKETVNYDSGDSLNIFRSSFKSFSSSPCWVLLVIKETYRCRSSLSWTFIVADDTFRLVSHQIRQTFLRLWALITVESLCKVEMKSKS